MTRAVGRLTERFSGGQRPLSWVGVGLGVIFVVGPLVLPSYGHILMTEILTYCLFAISFDLLLGYTGLLSFGHCAFYGAGAYAVALLTRRGLTDNFFLVALVVIVSSAVLAVLFGFPILRTAGIYFAFVSLGFAQALYGLAYRWTAVTGGMDGISGVVPPFGLTGTSVYYFVLAMFALCLVAVKFIVNSRFGRILVGIRENEQRMQALGYNTWAFKYSCYILAGVFAALAGMLSAYHKGIASPDDFMFSVSGLVLLIVLIGGRASQLGSLIGSIIVVLLMRLVSSYTDHWMGVVGIVFMLVVLFARDGIMGYLSQWEVSLSRVRSTNQ